MQTLSINLADIEIGERHRALSEDAVQRLSASMREIGLKQPITIRITDNVMIDGKPCDGVPVLVAGAHRLAAAKLLGWERIDCIEMDDDALKAELWEIAENLHRCDLTVAERHAHIRRYAEILEQRAALGVSLHGETKPSPLGGRPKTSITSKIAEDTGLSRSAIHKVLNPKSKPIDPSPREPEDYNPSRKRMMSAWNTATAEDRAWFRDWIDEPIMDARHAA